MDNSKDTEVNALKVIGTTCFVDILWFSAIIVLLVRFFVLLSENNQIVGLAIILSIFTNLFLYYLVAIDENQSAKGQELHTADNVTASGCWTLFVTAQIVANLAALVVLTIISDFLTLGLLSLVIVYVIYISYRLVQ